MLQPLAFWWVGSSGHQGLVDSCLELSALRLDSTFEALQDIAVFANKEFLEVPGHISCWFSLIEGGVGLGGFAHGVHLVKQFEAGAVGRGTEALDLLEGAGLLGAEVIAGKGKHLESSC